MSSVSPLFVQLVNSSSANCLSLSTSAPRFLKGKLGPMSPNDRSGSRLLRALGFVTGILLKVDKYDQILSAKRFDKL
jgi:hypothetical protein